MKYRSHRESIAVSLCLSIGAFALIPVWLAAPNYRLGGAICILACGMGIVAAMIPWLVGGRGHSGRVMRCARWCCASVGLPAIACNMGIFIILWVIEHVYH